MLFKFIKTLTIPLILVSLAVQASPLRQRRVVIHVNSPDVIWKNSELDKKMEIALSRSEEFSVILSNNQTNQPRFPKDHYNLENLINWGAELGGQYLLVVDIFDERIERNKIFSIPLIMQRYKTSGIIEGEIRFIDIARNKLLNASPLYVEIDGPARLQAWVDDDINDADLHIKPSGKIAFLNSLEQETALELVKIIKKFTNSRN
ncbi:MAG: hypothetical protein DRP35_01115 [Candidatus Zixiibacteriota bacterium]|nr:MAG: hypothetical protein DRP35_01115 [candidate division Zixibacteria bacterium]